ncbi:MAG: hypothetical protein E6R04_11195 [Spirochaetes bacterium]|nr:MAG: hypothetical protein E6R04_11195 [Spirochaetota bacterium]
MELTSNRFFGIEIECKGLSMAEAATAITNAGIPCVVQGYNHHATSTWKIVPDGSVYSGFEVVSPKLHGSEGLEQVRKVAETLVRSGARIERDCGFHVHVDASGLNALTLYNIVKRYAAFETEIDAFMPPSRRGANNNYCRQSSYFLRELTMPEANSEIRTLLRRLSQDDRYYKVNLMAYLRHGTVEFRHHSGTVSANKMIPWIIFCVNFVETSIVRVLSTPTQPTTPAPTSTANDFPPPAWLANYRSNSVERKFYLLARALWGSSRWSPVSSERLAEVLGCPVSGVSSYLSRFREAHPDYNIVARRGRGYYLDIFGEAVREQFLRFVGFPREMSWEIATPAVVDAGRTYTVIQPEERGMFHGLSQDVISYFQERATELSER